MTIFEFLGLDGNFVVLNVLLQVSVFAGVALFVAMRFKHNAAIRYAILYPAMLALLVLVAASIAMQTGDKKLLYIPLAPANLQTEVVIDNEIAAATLAPRELASTGPHLVELELPGPPIFVSISSGLLGPLWRAFSGLPLYLIAAVIWGGGFLVLALGLLRSLYRVKAVSRQSKRLSASGRNALNKVLSNNLPAAKHLRYRVSEQVDSPMLTGFIKPTVLLPTQFLAGLNDQQLKNILLHELAHHERRDVLANFLQKICLAVFWFHPLVHIMDRLISRAREEICDNYVLAQTEAVSYGETLLHVGAFSQDKAKGFGNGRGYGKRDDIGIMQLAVGMIGGEWKLEQRISELLSDHREKTMKLGTGINQLLQLSLVVFSISLAACQVGAAENEPLRDEVEVTQLTQVQATAQVEPAARAEPAEPAEQAEPAAQVQQAEQVDRAMLLAQASEVQRQDDAGRLQQDAITEERQFRRLQQELNLKRIDLQQHALEIESRVRGSIDVEEIRRTVASSMEQLRISRQEIDALVGEDGILNEEQINRIVAGALAEVQRQLESIDFAQLEKDLELSLDILRDKLQGLDLDMESLLEDVDNLTTQFGAPATPSEDAPVPL